MDIAFGQKQIDRIVQKDEMKNLGKNKAYKKNYLVTDNLSVFSLLACNDNVSVTKLELVKKKKNY